MNPVLEGLARTFVGGELEVQNVSAGYAYRGEVASIEFKDADQHNGAMMTVRLAWNAKAVGRSTPHTFMPTGGWDELGEAELEYSCSTDLPSPEIDAPNFPNVNFISDGRIAIDNPYTGEMTVLFPKGGSKLSYDKVRWLPDGPKAKYDEARRLAEEEAAAKRAAADADEVNER